MEIERKYLIDALPAGYDAFPYRALEQGYLCTGPVVRIRRDNNDYILTYKGSGLMMREEYNLPLTKEAYEHLREKTDGRLIQKKRYIIPLSEGYRFFSEDAADNCPPLFIELDLFEGALAPLVLAEVEFPDEDLALSFVPPVWFGRDVTMEHTYQNSHLSNPSFVPHCTK